MRRTRLLDRIRQNDSQSRLQTGMESGEIVVSVIEHLGKLLNSRQGTTLMDPGFGMPDFTDLKVTFPDSVRELERSITKTIEHYEPRMQNVDVDFVFQDDQDLTLFFQISAQIDTESDMKSIFLESTIDASGKMRIRR